MKIGIYDPYLDTMSGGERYMLSLARCLASDHTVSVFWDTQKEAEIRAEAERKFHMDLEGITFVDSIFTPQTSLIQRLKASQAYDAIVVLSDGSIPFLACDTVLHFQSPVEWVHGQTIMNRLKLKRVKQIICNSEYTKKYIDRKFHVNSTVLYPPVDLPEKKETKKEHLILNLGRMGIRASGSSYKKQEILRDAFKQMVKDGLKGWELVFIVNVTDQEQDVAQEFITSVKDFPIKVIVNPDMETVKDYYQKASLYWHAAGFGEDLVTHPDRAEHFGLSTVEAMHFGAVPVVIKAGGQPEIVRDGKDGILWETEEALREETKKLMTDEKVRKELAESAQKRAELFTIERFCKELQTIIP